MNLYLPCSLFCSCALICGVLRMSGLLPWYGHALELLCGSFCRVQTAEYGTWERGSEGGSLAAVPDGCLLLLLAACFMVICFGEMPWMPLAGEQMLTSSVTGANAATRSLHVHTCCSEWDQMLLLPGFLLEVLLRYFRCFVILASLLLTLSDFVSHLLSF